MPSTRQPAKPAQSATTDSSSWIAQYLWLAGLFLSPLLFGSVRSEGQAVVGCLFALSVLVLFQKMGNIVPALLPAWFRWLAVGLLILPLVPLPVGIVSLVSPARVTLAGEFPVEAGALPQWLPLTVSFAGTWQRIWEISLLVTCFSLARHSAARPGFSRRFVGALALAVVCLAASDVWYRMDGRRALLGIWKVNWGLAAGTFANRNHFADWLCVACIFLGGWWLRNMHPLRGARPGAAMPLVFRLDMPAIILVIFFGVGMAMASGSRGGIIALLAGLLVWVVLLAQRSHSRTRWLPIGIFLVAVAAVILFSGDLVFRRLAEAKTDLTERYPKTEIWHQSFLLFLKFPLLGTGWGSFVTAFNHFKGFGGDSTFWHVENDYLQLLVETGLAGAAVYAAFLGRLVWFAGKPAWDLSFRVAEPELYFGAVAALAAFAVHALFEFVFQVTATALLAAALAGFLCGWRDSRLQPTVAPPASRRRVLMNLFWALGLGIVASLQGMAFLHWQAGAPENGGSSTSDAVGEIRRSLNLWPWSVDRQIALTRARINRLTGRPRQEQLEEASTARIELNHTLARDPYNWRLRMERASLDIAYSTNSARALAEAQEVMRLNPLQPQIGIRFARYFARSNPAVAWGFLVQVSPIATNQRPELLTLAWQLKHDSSALWLLTPDTREGLSALGQFALENNLNALAAAAFLQLSNRADNIYLAGKFLEARRPDLAVTMVSVSAASNREQLILAEASYQLADYPSALRHAEIIFNRHPRAKYIAEISSSPNTLNTLRAEWAAQPTNSFAAVRLADKICQLPVEQRDMTLLNELAAKFPGELHLRWLLYHSELDRHRYQEASRLAIELARYIIRSS